MRYFCVSDIHGFYDELMIALNEAGFDIKTSQTKNIIKNVDFKLNPEMLKAIITTPENIERVKVWLKESGIKVESDIVMDYEEFLSLAKRRSLEI